MLAVRDPKCRAGASTIGPRRLDATLPQSSSYAASMIRRCLVLPLALSLTMLAPPAAAQRDQIVGSWLSPRDRERLTFSRNGEVWSCFDATTRNKVARGYWKEVLPGRFELHFTHVGLSDCSFVGARERRMQVDISSIASINGATLEVFNSGEGPPDTYQRSRAPRLDPPLKPDAAPASSP